MRICLYTDTAKPKLGGQEFVVDALARQFRKLGLLNKFGYSLIAGRSFRVLRQMIESRQCMCLTAAKLSDER